MKSDLSWSAESLCPWRMANDLSQVRGSDYFMTLKLATFVDTLSGRLVVGKPIVTNPNTSLAISSGGNNRVSAKNCTPCPSFRRSANTFCQICDVSGLTPKGSFVRNPLRDSSTYNRL